MVVDSVLVICILKIENLFRISTCPPLPEMLAYKMHAVRGFGRRVFGFRIYFLPEKTRISQLRSYASLECWSAGLDAGRKLHSTPTPCYFGVFPPCWASNLAYFLRNLSIRPAVSTSFCLPVKKGWHLEQISTLIFFLLDPTSTTLPHAQRTEV